MTQKETMSNLINIPYYKQENCGEQESNNEFPLLALVLTFSFFMFALEYYLDIRQLNKFLTTKV